MILAVLQIFSVHLFPKLFFSPAINYLQYPSFISVYVHFSFSVSSHFIFSVAFLVWLCSIFASVQFQWNFPFQWKSALLRSTVDGFQLKSWPTVTISDQLWPSSTIFDHLWPPLTNSDQLWLSHPPTKLCPRPLPGYHNSHSTKTNPMIRSTWWPQFILYFPFEI